MTNTIESRFAEAQQLRTHYLCAGEGEPLVLLHGWPEWSHAWRPVIGRLADRFALYAPDFRGFGETQKSSIDSTAGVTPEQLGADVLDFADALGLRRFGLVSHDLGSVVAQVVARRAPQRVRGLFFFNLNYPGIGARWISPDHIRETWYQCFHQLPWAAELVGFSRDTCKIYLGAMLNHWAHRKEVFTSDELDIWIDNLMRPGNLQGGFYWYRNVHDARMAAVRGEVGALPPIELPTRVLWGAHDPVLKAEWVDRLPEFFTRLECSLAQEAGHFVHLEAPDLAATEMERFFTAIP